MSEVLRLDSIGKRFGERAVLTAATLSVHAGRIRALFGRNGCGKTTLIEIATGAIRADHGVVRFRGRHVPAPRLHRLAREGLFYLPDRGLLVRGWTVARHLDRMAERFPGAGRDGVDGIIRALALEALLDSEPDRLSGGERRRAEIALALLRRPACLLADEPLRGVAPRDAELVSAALRELAGGGCGILLTGHDPELLLPLAHAVTWMHAGTTLPLGDPAAARLHEGFRREYLGPGRRPSAAP